MIDKSNLQVNRLRNLPTPSTKRIAMHVKPAAERALRGGHPWLFEEGVRKQNREGEAGDLAVVFDKKDKFLAVGLYDPYSRIRVKVLQHGQPAIINVDWFQPKLTAAIKLREPLTYGQTTGYRMVHGENDGLPGLVIDRYAGTLVLKLYTSAWMPYLHDIAQLLLSVQPAEKLILRLSRLVQEQSLYGLKDGMSLAGELPSIPIVFEENGLRFAADVIRGHKTGFFFDQRENRERVSAMTAGKSVLDVFAYSGGFSLYAAAGGAHSVTSLDVSRPALEAAQSNFRLNVNRPEVKATAHEIVVDDAFAALERFRLEGRKFDVVVIDPPSFAKQQSEIDRALRSYRELAVLGQAVVSEGGRLVMASCSSRVRSDDFFRVVRQALQHQNFEMQTTGHALDHPIGFPEGAYLKCAFVIFR